MEHKDRKLTFRFGDHIKVRRALGIYSHHGVYIGNNNVLHLTGDPKRGLPVLSWGEGMANVKIQSIQEFENGTESLIVKKAMESQFDKSLFLQMVQNIIDKDEEYNLVTHNCEHFANEITEDQTKSGQIQSALYAGTIGGVSAMAGLVTFHTLTGTLFVPVIVTGLSFWGLQYL